MTRPNFCQYVLDAMPGTKAAIVKKSGVSRASVLDWIRVLHADHKIYIASWLPHPRAGAAMAVYAVGNKPDAACKLKHLTPRQIRLRYEAKAKQDGRYDVVRARMRNRYWVKKAAATGDPMVLALFGGARAGSCDHA